METLIREAFQQAYDYKQSTYKNLNMIESVSEYVHNYGGDRRYRLFFNAASSSFRSAIVTYRGIRYYVEHDYPSNTYKVERTSR